MEHSNNQHHRALPGNKASGQAINILLVGRSQSGKSSIVKLLADPTATVESRGFSDTKDLSCETLFSIDPQTNEECQMNVIDTAGLGETRQDGRSRSDDQLLQAIAADCRRSVNHLNIICFVMVANGIGADDISIIQKLQAAIGSEYRAMSMLILTHCDEYDESVIESFIEQLKSHEQTRPLVEYCHLGIFHFGAIDKNKRFSANNEIQQEIVEGKKQRIAAMRNNLLTALIENGRKGQMLIPTFGRQGRRNVIEQGNSTVTHSEPSTNDGFWRCRPSLFWLIACFLGPCILFALILLIMILCVLLLFCLLTDVCFRFVSS